MNDLLSVLLGSNLTKFLFRIRMKADFISLLLVTIIAPEAVTCSLQEDYFKLSAEDIDGEVVQFEKFKGMVSN